MTQRRQIRPENALPVTGDKTFKMPEISPADQEFLNQLNDKIAENIANEQFGVSELADALNMSRSNLLRKVKKATNLSVSQLISQVRLNRGMELLRAGSLNVSEVSVHVGFSSTSYFIKCFREYFGYPPGEVGKRTNEPVPVPVAPPPAPKSNRNLFVIGIAAVVVIAIGIFAYMKWPMATSTPVEKSIAVLPFKNDSNDSTNLYIINGLMESTLNNLQKIKDLRVISRTSTEKYRNNTKTIPEMASELNVTYFIEGSGQKIGNRIVLNIQLIEGTTDRHLWSRQYRRETKDIFALQQEISKDIAEEIQVVITPDERTRLEKVQTKNPQAYDLFLKALDIMNRGGDSNLERALVYLDSAIKEDENYAMAHAVAAMACYYLDAYKKEQTHTERLGIYADKALLLDPTLGESYMAKAFYYLVQKESSAALPFLEKALEYSPNSTQIVNQLADFYFTRLPNTGKYLEYALKGLRLNANSGDSVSTSNFHLHLANALIQAGFVDESLKHLDKSLEYSPGNPYTRHLRPFVLYAKNGDLNNTRALLAKEFQKDTTRFDILQDIGKVSYYLNDYDSAYKSYKRFDRFRETYKLDIYLHENMLIGKIYERMGDKERAKQLYQSHRQWLDKDQTAYKHLGLAFVNCDEGNSAKALEHLKLFAKEDNIQYWIILFMDKAPDQTETERLPEFQNVMREIEKKFWANHEKLKLTLEEKGLL
jgi:TolB-like protein/AraC-like DNA-binding protein/tetratricopeptide (TPR) repeat protein